MNTINLDLKTGAKNIINLMQFDVKGEKINIVLTENDVAYSLSGKTIRLQGIKADGKALLLPTTIKNDNTIEVDIVEQLTVVKGIIQLQLLIFGDGGSLKNSKIFGICVDESLRIGEIIASDNDFKEIKDTLIKVDEWDKEFADKTGKLEEKYTTRLNGIDGEVAETKAISKNPIGALQQSNYKIPLEMFDDTAKQAIIGTTPLINAKGLDNNIGVTYPLSLKTRNSVIQDLHADLKNAILDVKVINAKIDKYYMITWVGNGTTSFVDAPLGEYGIALTEYDKGTFSGTDGATGTIIIDRKDCPSNPLIGLQTRVIKSKTTDIVLTITLDYSKLKTNKYNLYTNTNTGYSCVIDEGNYVYKIIEELPVVPEVNTKSMVCFKSGQQVIVKFKYDETRNMCFELNQLGVNKITHPKKVGFKTENELTLDTTFTLDYEIVSDWISPHKIRVTNDKLNDNTVSTGGNHGTNGGNGFPTARHRSTTVYIDDILISENKNEYCNEVKIITVNRAIGGNTLNLMTGEGREALEETVIYTIKNGNIYITVELRALEDLRLMGYEGIQMTRNNYENFYFADDTNIALIPTTTPGNLFSAIKSTNINTDRFVFKKGTDLLIGFIDRQIGIGNKDYISNTQYLGLWNGSKAYLHNINGTELSLDKFRVAYYSGGYCFTKHIGSSAESSYILKYPNEDIYVVDFTRAQATFLPFPKEFTNKKVEVIESKNAKCGVIILQRGLELISTGAGFIKFKVT